MVRELVGRLVREEEGQGLAEYVLLFVLVVVVAILGLALFGGKVRDNYYHVSNNM
uniref:Flp family type IVb pilin n=1 Tax=Ammonifex degensii TaxID=42838 RepID=A0A7C1F2K6_9THEO